MERLKDALFVCVVCAFRMCVRKQHRAVSMGELHPNNK